MRRVDRVLGAGEGAPQGIRVHDCLPARGGELDHDIVALVPESVSHDDHVGVPRQILEPP